MKFLLPIRGADEECFLINFNGEFHAYVNRCRHVPMPMDWVDNQFFAEEGRYLMCQTHNAYYEPGSGECIAGPASACGKFLYRVPLEIKDERHLCDTSAGGIRRRRNLMRAGREVYSYSSPKCARTMRAFRYSSVPRSSTMSPPVS